MNEQNKHAALTMRSSTRPRSTTSSSRCRPNGDCRHPKAVMNSVKISTDLK